MKIGITLQPVDTVLDGSNLAALVHQWQAALLEDGAAASTVEGYSSKLLHFTGWWSAAGPAQGWELRKSDMQSFARWLETVQTATGKPLSYNTRRDVHRRLQQCLRWAFRTERLPLDLAHWVPAARGAQPRRKAPTLEELEKLLDAGNLAAQPVRDRAVLGMLIGTGMRRAELSGMNLADLTFNHATGTGFATVRGKRTRANATGERMVALDAPTVRFLVDYLQIYRLDPSGPLFVWHDGAEVKRLGANAIYRIVRRAARRAGLADKLRGAHDLRRAYASHMLRYLAAHDEDLSADLVRRQLGHASFAMTSYYNKTEVTDLGSGVMKSPLTIMEA